MLAVGAVAAMIAGASPSRAQQTIRVGWTIPAEESKYWMMRRPAEFPDIGKTYNIEWTQFQGTAPMTQALAAGALDCATQAPLSLANGVVRQSQGLHRGAARLREARWLLGLLGGHG
jgi:NitT/TauT family transport system substrate-binding protein